MPKKSDKPRDPTQTVALQVRIKEELRAELEQAAGESGRPMNTEIAGRLSTSLREDSIFGNDENRAFVIWLASDIRKIEGMTGRKWTEDRATFEAVKLAAVDAINRKQPRPEDYEDGMQLLREGNDALQRSDEIKRTLLGCGAMKVEYPNALLNLGRGDLKPYYVVVDDESAWQHPEDADAQLTDDDKDAIRKLIAEHNELQSSWGERAKRLDAFTRSSRDAEKRGAEIYAEFKEGFDKMVKAALERADAS